MSVGIAVNKAGIDFAAGGASKDLALVFARIDSLKIRLDTLSESDLQTQFGYSAQEAGWLKSAVADLSQLGTIYRGDAALASAKDFRTFSKFLWGASAI